MWTKDARPNSSRAQLRSVDESRAKMGIKMAMHPEYRAKWVTAGYHSKMGSAEVVPPPPAAFLRVYHITTAEYGISDIALRRDEGSSVH